MLGAITGDIVGSRFEWNNIKSKDFEFLNYHCEPTDDSIMSLAIAKALLLCKSDYSDLESQTILWMQEIGKRYPNAGYGGSFFGWIYSDNPKPYNSWGNGAAMRVSACAHVASSINEAIKLSKIVTEVTHNHPEGVKGAEATTVAIYMALHGSSILEIRDYINANYYPMNFTLDGIRKDYSFDVSCQGSVPQALMAFFESMNFEDAIRNAVSIGGDSDTIGAITGSIAEAYYGIPASIRNHVLTYLDQYQLTILNEFESRYGVVLEKKTDSTIRSVKYVPENDTEKAMSRADEVVNAVKTTKAAVDSTETEFENTTTQKLFSHIYACCDILRGPINQDEYKTYVIPILFLKRISDIYDEETILATEEYGEDVSDFGDDEIHRFIIPEGCHWDDIRMTSENVGMAIVNSMTGIERKNPDTLGGLFSSFDDANWTDKNKLSDARLKDLVEHMSKIKLGNQNYSADVIGDAYEYCLKKWADIQKKNAGEFYTPRSVVKLLVKILDPKAGETIYDGACGTGGMLIEAIRHMNDERASFGKIYGQEKNLATSAIARMNLYLHGAQDFKIMQGDTLLSPAFMYRGEIQRFNCCIANPPFGLKNWGASAFASDVYGRNLWGAPTDGSADFAWIQHFVKSMDEKTGRAAIIMPDGVLFHGNKEGEIRKQLVISDKIEAIVSFVSGLFYGAGVSACALILNNNKLESHKGKILLIDAEKIYTPKIAQNIMTDSNVDEVFDLYQGYADIIEKSKVVTLDEVAQKDYVLSVNGYIEREKQEVIAPEIVRKNYFEAVRKAKEAEEILKELLVKEGLLNE